MNEHSLEQVSKFFAGISSWRSAYSSAQLNYLATRKNDKLMLLSARIYLESAPNPAMLDIFNTGNIAAGQWVIPQDTISVEDVVKALVSADGLFIEGHGHLILANDESREISASAPMLLHHEGISSGNRLSVLSITGAQIHNFLPQPESDWALKAANIPFDNINELTQHYTLGTIRGDSTTLEVIARNVIQVYAASSLKEDVATVGLWMAKNLSKSKSYLGHRVIHEGNVVLRASIPGDQLAWNDEDYFSTGTISIKVPVGSIIQLFACYDGSAHQTIWRADPAIFQNPRSSVLSTIDPTGHLISDYLFPELPPKGKAADDFEAAISWSLWGLGFSPANFGLNAKTRDAYDIVAMSPSGGFVIVECTLGLLRAESKLSKLAARAASLREMLDKSNMKHLPILPVIITAMTIDQVKADITQAEDTGVLVLSREDIEKLLEELLRFPDADKLFERGMQKIAANGSKTKDLFSTLNNE